MNLTNENLLMLRQNALDRKCESQTLIALPSLIDEILKARAIFAAMEEIEGEKEEKEEPKEAMEPMNVIKINFRQSV